MELADWIERLRSLPPVAAWVALGLAAFVEYVFPPFPGDLVVLAGAALVAVFGWQAPPVLAAVTLGAVIGSAVDFQVGRWLVARGWLDRLSPERRADVDALVDRFRRHGPWFLALNRFAPGVRAFFFVAAGLAGLRWPAVLGWSTVSALTWNTLLVGAGFAAGSNLERLETWFGWYNLVAMTVIALVIAAGIGHVLRRRTRS